MAHSYPKEHYNPPQTMDKPADSKLWWAPIYASVSFVANYTGKDPTPKNFTKQNIVSYLKVPMAPMRLHNTSGRLYFDPSRYSPEEDKVKDSLSALVADLSSSAKAHGFDLTRNGSHSRKHGYSTTVKCGCFRAFTPMTLEETKRVKMERLQNDALTNNTRPNGKPAIRRARPSQGSKRPSDPSAVCGFGFAIHSDRYGLYIKANYGNAMHSNHRPFSFMTTKKAAPTVPLRERLMPLIEELLDLHESPDVDTSVVPPIEPLLKTLKAEIAALKSTVADYAKDENGKVKRRASKALPTQDKGGQHKKRRLLVI